MRAYVKKEPINNPVLLYLTLRSRLRYWIASEMCSDAIESLPSMSARVRRP